MFKILQLIAHSIQLSYSKGEVYELVSSEFHKYGIFAVMVGNINVIKEANLLKDIDVLSCVVKTMEFISITSDGLELLYDNI